MTKKDALKEAREAGFALGNDPPNGVTTMRALDALYAAADEIERLRAALEKLRTACMASDDFFYAAMATEALVGSSVEPSGGIVITFDALDGERGAAGHEITLHISGHGEHKMTLGDTLTLQVPPVKSGKLGSHWTEVSGEFPALMPGPMTDEERALLARAYPPRVTRLPVAGSKLARISDIADDLIRELKRQGLEKLQAVFQGILLRVEPYKEPEKALCEHGNGPMCPLCIPVKST
jgi:hypothetical protein